MAPWCVPEFYEKREKAATIDATCNSTRLHKAPTFYTVFNMLFNFKASWFYAYVAC